MAPDQLISNRIILRVETESAAPLVLSLYEKNRDAFERFEPTRPRNFYTLDYHITSLNREYYAYTAETFLRYYIYLKESPDEIIGSINYNFRWDNLRRFAEIGYKLDERFQGQGIAYEACVLSMSVLPKYYNIHHVDARIHPENPASIRLATKLGFAPKCLEPKSANILGKDVDLVRYSLTSPLK